MSDFLSQASTNVPNPLNPLAGMGGSKPVTPPAKKLPIITERKKKSNLPLLLGLLALLLVGGGWYLWSTVLSKQTSILDIQEGSKKVQIKNVNWQKDVFENPVFTSLEDTHDEPLVAGTSEGNPNPFTKKLKK